MGCLKRYDSVIDILKKFFELRLHYYKLRKDWCVGSLGAEAAKAQPGPLCTGED